MGLKGHITNQLCNPWQDFMDIPCGCYSRFGRRLEVNGTLVELPDGEHQQSSSDSEEDLYSGMTDEEAKYFDYISSVTESIEDVESVSNSISEGNMFSIVQEA